MFLKSKTLPRYARIFGVSAHLRHLGLRHEHVLPLAIESLISGSMFSFEDLQARAETHDSSPALAAVRRLINALHPINRVGGGSKHPLVEFPDALRPDSLEMRALAALANQCVRDRFGNADHVNLLRASLQL